jgi:DNA-cytosine methyltransferase
LRVLELFAGIGGFAATFPNLEIVEAVDIDQTAREVYSANFSHRYSIKEIASLPLEWFSRLNCDVWWMSPPCTPFTHRGAKRDIHDNRSAALKHLIHVATILRPSLICLENVVGFESSQAYATLQEEWTKAGYKIQTHTLCPSNLGWPNRRPRVYCIASQVDRARALSTPEPETLSLSRFIDDTISPETHPTLWLAQKTVDRYLDAMDRVAILNSSATDTPTNTEITACFASSYGKSIIRSGSYLETKWGYRRFSPREVARLLGFSDTFRLPETLSLERQWHLLGNSLSLPAVRHVMGHNASIDFVASHFLT